MPRNLTVFNRMHAMGSVAVKLTGRPFGHPVPQLEIDMGDTCCFIFTPDTWQDLAMLRDAIDAAMPAEMKLARWEQHARDLATEYANELVRNAECSEKELAFVINDLRESGRGELADLMAGAFTAIREESPELLAS